jgi:hypothetical protein
MSSFHLKGGVKTALSSFLGMKIAVTLFLSQEPRLWSFLYKEWFRFLTLENRSQLVLLFHVTFFILSLLTLLTFDVFI